MRAASLDASLLDTELTGLLTSPLHAALKFFHPTFVSNYDPELVALLRLALWKVGIWDNSASYGSLIQNLHYRTIQNGVAVPPSRRQKLANAGLTVVVPYLLSKIESWLTLSNDVSPAPWKDRLQRFITNVENIFSTLSLLNFFAFLLNGRYRSIPDRVLKLRLLPLTKSQAHHLLSYEFLNRQLTWTSLTEFLLFILPLILPSYRRLRRRLVRATKSGDPETAALATLPERFCAICFSQGREGRLITNPYRGECGHAYCYTCLLGEVAGEEGDGWSCLRCGSVIKHVDRWKEVIGEEPPTENKQEKNEVEEVKEGSSGEESSIEEIVTPESEEVEEEDGGEANSEEGQNLFG